MSKVWKSHLATLIYKTKIEHISLESDRCDCILFRRKLKPNPHHLSLLQSNKWNWTNIRNKERTSTAEIAAYKKLIIFIHILLLLLFILWSVFSLCDDKTFIISMSFIYVCFFMVAANSINNNETCAWGECAQIYIIPFRWIDVNLFIVILFSHVTHY